MQPGFARRTQADQLGLARAFDWVRDAVVVADVESGTIVVWNPAAEAVFGYTAEQAMALPLEELIPDELSRPATHL